MIPERLSSVFPVTTTLCNSQDKWQHVGDFHAIWAQLIQGKWLGPAMFQCFKLECFKFKPWNLFQATFNHKLLAYAQKVQHEILRCVSFRRSKGIITIFLFSHGTYEPWHINHPGKPFSDNCFKLGSEQSLNSTSGESSIVKITVLQLSVLPGKRVLALCTSPCCTHWADVLYPTLTALREPFHKHAGAEEAIVCPTTWKFK